MKLAYIGYGAFARQLEQVFAESGVQVTESVYFDDCAANEKLVNAFPFASCLSAELNEYQYVLALGYHHLQRKQHVAEELLKQRKNLFTYVHPSAQVSPSTRIAPGAIIFSGCTICMNVVVGPGTVIYNGCVVAHDVTIGACSFLAPGVTIAGRTVLEDRCFVGCGSAFANDLHIGADVVVGMATAVSKSIASGHSVIGNPQRVLKTKLRLT